MSGKEQLPEERWRKISMSGSLRGRRSEEMTQSNTSFLRGSEVAKSEFVMYYIFRPSKYIANFFISIRRTKK